MHAGEQRQAASITAGEIPRPEFSSQITQIAEDLGLGLEWHSAHWIAQLRKGSRVIYIIGYIFPLNNAASAQLAHDKVATYTLLHASGIPAVPHYLLRFPSEGASVAEDTSAPIPVPLVLKPNDGSAGIDVHRVRREAEYAQVLSSMVKRYRAIAVSPWISIDQEYRVVVLDGTCRIAYSKMRHQPGTGGHASEWRHNLHHGATPELVTDKEMERELNSMALAAMSSLGLRFASVDIVTSSEGASVLEVNGAVTLERFSGSSPFYSNLAMNVYADAIKAAFE
jgi:ribosomal protein S6--L-glutamate ligase